MTFLLFALAFAAAAGIIYWIVTLKIKLAHSLEREKLAKKAKESYHKAYTESSELLNQELNKKLKCPTTVAGKKMYHVTLQFLGYKNGQQQITHWTDTALATDAAQAIGYLMISDDYLKHSKNNELGIFGWSAKEIPEHDHNLAGYYKKEEECPEKPEPTS